MVELIRTAKELQNSEFAHIELCDLSKRFLTYLFQEELRKLKDSKLNQSGIIHQTSDGRID